MIRGSTMLKIDKTSCIVNVSISLFSIKLGWVNLLRFVTMLNADKKTREARCAASLEGFYAKHPLELVSEKKTGNNYSIKCYRNRKAM